MFPSQQTNSNIYCPFPLHQDQQCFAICIEDTCEKRGLLCFKVIPHLSHDQLSVAL